MKRLLLVVILVGCERDAPKTAKPEVVKPAEPAVAPMLPAHVEAVRAAAAAYTTWGRVDERPHAAPTDCAPPGPIGKASQVRRSAADDGPHGRKLYFLWASDRGAYIDKKVENGFAIVKESFAAVPARANAKPPRDDMFGMPEPIRTAVVDGKRVETGEPAGLFVMAKIGGDGTDAGWIYGTMVNGAVTSAGRVASCMGCHEDAPDDRLFGIPD